MERQLNTIDPNQNNVPESAVIQKVTSENDRLPNGEHEKAVQAFFRSDSIASGIGKDFAFVEKIPQLIDEIIKNKSWECLYVSKSVVTPYYCRYTKGTDSENFRAFIAAKRPNGLETTIETVDRLLEADLEVRNKFRTVIYESRQGERNDLLTSGGDCPKLDLSERQQKTLRAANRAAEAIPEIRELLDRGLIAIDIAAKLGRDIKDLDNLTAEEREYVDKRDLVGLRIKQYTYTNIIPEDEDKEPAYSRQLNEFVKDLLGIKDRSKSVRMDDPKKAAKKLLEFYEGQKLQELLKYLTEGLEPNISVESKTLPQAQKQISTRTAEMEGLSLEVSSDIPVSSSKNDEINNNGADGAYTKQCGASNYARQASKPRSAFGRGGGWGSPSISNHGVETKSSGSKRDHPNEFGGQRLDNSNELILNNNSENTSNLKLSRNQLAERLKVKPKSISYTLFQHPDRFSQWTQEKDPEGLGWQETEKKGRSYFFIPIQTANQK